MSTHSADLKDNSRPAESPDLHRLQQVLGRVFRNYPGSLGLRLWNGETMLLGTGRPAATLVLRTAQAFRSMVIRRDLLGLAAESSNPAACFSITASPVMPKTGARR